MNDLFAAVSINQISANVSAILVSFVAIGLLYVGFRFIKASLRFANSSGSQYPTNYKEMHTMQERRSQRRRERRWRKSGVGF